MRTINFLTGLIVIAIFLASCNNDDDPTDTTKPVIENLEVGHNDTIHPGGKVHLAFDASDNERLSHYRIVIHPEEDGHHGKSASEEDEWELDTTIYDNFDGLKNASPHHDFPIDSTAHLGEYHFDLTVVDQAGNSITVDQELIMAEGEHDDDHDDHDDHK